MITLLRKLRMLFIEQNKVRNYILYALGEIILIVLGILIALQINNWNQGKILDRKEVAYVEDIRTGLDFDLNRNSHIGKIL